MKIWSLVIKGVLMLGVLVCLSSFQVWVVNEMNRFTMDYTLGLVLVNLAPVIAYGLIGILISLGYSVKIPLLPWIGLGVLVVLVGMPILLSNNGFFFVKYNRLIQEIWRVGGLILGMVVGNALTHRIQKA